MCELQINPKAIYEIRLTHWKNLLFVSVNLWKVYVTDLSRKHKKTQLCLCLHFFSFLLTQIGIYFFTCFFILFSLYSHSSCFFFLIYFFDFLFLIPCKEKCMNAIAHLFNSWLWNACTSYSRNMNSFSGNTFEDVWMNWMYVFSLCWDCNTYACITRCLLEQGSRREWLCLTVDIWCKPWFLQPSYPGEQDHPKRFKISWPCHLPF